jgi:hypothetical protein
MAKNTYIKRRFRLFLSNSWPRWPRFRSLGLISPLIRRIIRALERIALLIFEGVTLPSPTKSILVYNYKLDRASSMIAIFYIFNSL